MPSDLPCEFLPTGRGKFYLARAHYLYVENHEKKGVKYFRCYSKSCKQKLTLERIGSEWSAGHVEVEHDHEPHTRDIIRIKFTNSVKATVKENKDIPLRRAYEKGLDTYSDQLTDEILGVIPSLQSLKSTLYSIRGGTQYPDTPESKTINYTLHEEYCVTRSGWQFLLYDAFIGPGRITIFGSMQLLKVFAGISPLKLFMDGTFSVCPRMISQLYTIHFEYFDHVFPVIYALLPDRTEHTYRKVLEVLKIKFEEATSLELKPVCIQLDFEQAMLSATKKEFPDSSVIGCYFHFTQAVFRNAMRLGLRTEYLDLKSAERQFIQRIFALPMIPLAELNDCYEEIKTLYYELKTRDEAALSLNVLAFCDYFENTWLKDSCFGFGPCVWNQFINSGRRTTNDIEGWHNGMKSNFNCKPNIYRFIDELRIQQGNVETKLRQLGQLQAIKRCNTDYSNLHAEIENLKQAYKDKKFNRIFYLDQMRVKVRQP